MILIRKGFQIAVSNALGLSEVVVYVGERVEDNPIKKNRYQPADSEYNTGNSTKG